MAMPWSRAKELVRLHREDVTRQLALNCLFNSCFRIAREAGVPLVVENVKGAQPWVGPARAHFGSFYFWGDIDSVGSRIIAGRLKFGEALKAPKRTGGKMNPDGTEHPQGSWFKIADSKNRGSKNDGGSWFAVANNTTSGHGQNPDGRKVPGLGRGHDWRQDPSGRFNSKSKARKAASAQIAKIPFPLAQHIAKCFKPEAESRRGVE